MATALDRRPIAVLVATNLLGGVGVASGAAVGALLVEEHGSTAVAGLGQAASVLGAAVAAIPLATLAARRGRRWSLAAGYAIALVGAALIITAAVLGQIAVLIAGLGLFGVAQAVNLQSRYAASDGVPAVNRAKAISIVMWSTTVGAVVGPNLTAAGERLGSSVGVPGLAGPYLFSLVGFALGGLVVALLYRPARTTADASPPVHAGEARVDVRTEDSPAMELLTADRTDAASTTAAPVIAAPATVGAWAALRWALSHPLARFAVVLLASGHAVMVMVMVMTPLHMKHQGMSLEAVGVVISVHVLGMFALSPVIGWLADRYGAVRIAALGVGILGVAVVLGFVAASSGTSAGGDGVLTAVALTVLGVGWSATTISASALIASTSDDAVRVPLQGATDAGMSYAGAAAAALAGPILALGGFQAVNVAGALLLAPAIVLLVGVARRRAEASAAREPARSVR
ncbi:MFS transporter [Georgenia faecalis]|uniref:MFS transporter n=1 Tax=Georgenia faecalis TaxID=2483799 RepID=UPI001F49E632|nr:MFS transporter [Georgenia faecalis]